jgi:hypothetical protein
VRLCPAARAPRERRCRIHQLDDWCTLPVMWEGKGRPPLPEGGE